MDLGMLVARVLKVLIFFAHGSMVKITQKGSQMFVESFDKVHKSNMLVEENKRKV
jgi:uncharacterized membrane protein YphA (DoxX/SURF4 family)